MPGTDAFFDTNVLVYMTSGDVARAETSKRLLAARGVVSVQILNEFANVARLKLRFTWAEVREFLTIIEAACKVVPVTIETHRRGLELAERHHLAVYDGMVIAAAQMAGCSVLYSEDMHDGFVKDGLTIRNPYRS